MFAALIPTYKCALFTNLDLNGTGFAGGVRLLDLGGLAPDQGNFLSLHAGRAMAALQKRQQAVFVRISQDIRRLGLCHACGLQLLKQSIVRFFEFGCKLGDGRTGHLLGNL